MIHRVIIGLLLLVVGVGLPFSVSTLVSSKNRADSASAKLGECRALAEKISKLQASPGKIAAAQHVPGEIRKRIGDAAELAAVTASITRITEQGPRTLKDSPYTEQLTQVSFANVKLVQLIRFLKELTSAAEEHGVDSIRLSEPHGNPQDELETWSAEVVVSTLVYNPS